MTPMQRYAVEHPLWAAKADLRPYGGSLHLTAGLRLSAVLTVETFGATDRGRPLWHVSVMLVKKDYGRIRADASLSRMARDMLSGVGGDREWWKVNAKHVGHLIRQMTAAEVAALPPRPTAAAAGDDGLDMVGVERTALDPLWKRTVK